MRISDWSSDVCSSDLDILDRRDQYSWLSSEHQGKPWHSAEIAPSEFLNFAADELAVVASGRYSDLTPYHREGLEAMLIHGMSRRDDMFDQDLNRISEQAMGGRSEERRVGKEWVST